MNGADDEKTSNMFTVRAGSDGEALVTAPNGRMEFMGFWKFIRFVFAATWAGHKIEVKND